jgi:hypothetical protein
MNFIPHNALEEQLAAVHAGTLAPETFVQQLIEQQLFMPVRDEKNAIQGFQRSNKAELLVIEDEDGERVVAVFTSPERAKPFVEHYPDFSGGILTEFSWLLRRIGGGVPIALNPGWDIGMDFDADMIGQLIAQLPPEHAA